MNLKLKHVLVLLISLNLIARYPYCWTISCNPVTKDCSWLDDSSICKTVRQNRAPECNC